ncbi:glycosyltransferase family 4 protein [Aquisalimonas sp.]|uniref:MraY family glycosyltransferase n=1 Tax=Aquisalimonas sp. TaxID=1872621 RepID=UPI0025BF2A69|nr:glycosyltransferase family 4 protein [Aquisalimonas sp.]
MTAALLLLLVVVASWLITGAMRRYALHRGLLDVPNERSSHVTPTPSLGGVAIVAVCLVGLGTAGVLGAIPAHGAMALVGGGVLVAGVGLLDDYAPVAAPWRLLAHLGAAVWVLAWVGALPPLPVLGGELGPPWLVMLLLLLGITWLINLYNFMDGIDALAAIEALTVGVTAAGLLWLAGASGLALVTGFYAAAAFGFLLWNAPPAHIFMGDAGSGFLGVSFGALAILSHALDALVLWAWLILLGVFVVDATFTLVRRMVTGQRWHQAHRIHAYQHAARLYGHGPVSCAVAVINLVWLAPLAAVASLAPQWGLPLLLLGWAPLVVLAVCYRAGRPV